MGGQGAGNASAHVSAWCRCGRVARCRNVPVGGGAQAVEVISIVRLAPRFVQGGHNGTNEFDLQSEAVNCSGPSACFLHRAPPLIETLPSLPPWRAPPRPPSFCPAQPRPTGAATAHAWRAVAVGSSVRGQSLSGARPRRGRGAARRNLASTRCPLASRARAVQWRGRLATSPTVPL